MGRGSNQVSPEYEKAVLTTTDQRQVGAFLSVLLFNLKQEYGDFQGLL
jgi:hypothetical protein